MPEKEHVIVGTAGHIDHGKSALVKALTGIDPDTLPEEKERGMTIELGFVFLDIPDYERQIIFIDVPGHEKFVKTMVAGASHVDAALLVIAADEGISVQTREHFDILRLLRIPVGLIALTKADLVDEARLDELKAKVAQFVKGSFLESAAVIPVSAITKAGVPEVKETLMAIGRLAKTRPDSGLFRLPIDRVFTMRGFGTVIAGTVLAGEVRVGEMVEIYPEGIRARVRGIQVHKESKEKSIVGRRTALNLQDVEKELLRRGQVVAMPGTLTPAQRLDARLRLLSYSSVELKNRDRVRLHIGTDELIGRVALLDRDKLRPGDLGLVQFVLEAPAVALLGDRFVLRTFSPLTTIGGGEILDGTPPRHKRLDAQMIAGLKRWEGNTEEVAEQALIKSSLRPLSAVEIAKSLGRSEAEMESALQALLNRGRVIQIPAEEGTVFLLAEAFGQLKDMLMEIVRKYFEERPQLLYMPHSDLRARLLKLTNESAFHSILGDLGRQGKIIVKDAQVGLPGREMKLARKDQEAMDRIERKFRTARFETPLEEDIRRELGIETAPFRRLMQSLFQQGKLIRLNRKVVYHKDTFEAAKDVVVGHLRKTKSITIAELKGRLKMSRKYSHAILEYFDRTGLTKRVEDRHILR